MNAVEQTVADLTMRIDAVLAAIGELDPTASVFFLKLRRSLVAARDEVDLINTFIVLSTTAFQGFDFPPRSLVVIDELLADAERIAFTFTAGGETH